MLAVTERSGSNAAKIVAITPAPTTVFEALANTLRSLAEFVASMGEFEYRRCEFGGGSIGGHVRHCIDHVRLLLDGIESGVVDYDQRERGTEIERSPHCAFDTLQELEDRARGLDVSLLSRRICVRGLIDARVPGIEADSTVGRELLFVLSHTIHHNAMIAHTAHRMGASVSAEFGLAPGTLAHRRKMACAQSPSSH